MTAAEVYEFEQWVLRMYQKDNTVPFHILAQVLKAIRHNEG